MNSLNINREMVSSIFWLFLYIYPNCCALIINLFNAMFLYPSRCKKKVGLLPQMCKAISYCRKIHLSLIFWQQAMPPYYYLPCTIYVHIDDVNNSYSKSFICPWVGVYISDDLYLCQFDQLWQLIVLYSAWHFIFNFFLQLVKSAMTQDREIGPAPEYT